MCTHRFRCTHPRMWCTPDPHTRTLVQFHPQPNSTPVLWRISVTDTRAHPPPTGHPSTGVNLHPWVWVYTHGSPPDLPKTSLGTHVGDHIPSHGLCNTPCICPNMVCEVYMGCRWGVSYPKCVRTEDSLPQKWEKLQYLAQNWPVG